MGVVKVNNSTIGGAVGVNYSTTGKVVEVGLAVGKAVKVEN